jgi:hypothetical protein
MLGGTGGGVRDYGYFFDSEIRYCPIAKKRIGSVGSVKADMRSRSTIPHPMCPAGAIIRREIIKPMMPTILNDSPTARFLLFTTGFSAEFCLLDRLSL